MGKHRQAWHPAEQLEAIVRPPVETEGDIYQRRLGPIMSLKASKVPRAICVIVGERPWA